MQARAHSFGAVIAVTYMLTACGGDAGRAHALLGAVDATANQSSEKITLEGTMDLAGQMTTVTGSGAFLHRVGNMHLRFDTEGLGSTTMDEIFQDGVTWLRSPVLATSVYGRHWLKLDPGERASFLGFDLSAITGQTPADALDTLRRSGTVERLGTETVGGVTTTHYRRVLAPSAADVAYRTAEAWVDQTGLIRRLTLDLTARVHPPTDERAHIRLRMTFSDFGTHVTVRPPPPSDVLDSTATQSG